MVVNEQAELDRDQLIELYTTLRYIFITHGRRVCDAERMASDLAYAVYRRLVTAPSVLRIALEIAQHYTPTLVS